MAFTKMKGSMEIIRALSNFPNRGANRLSAADLKARFDEAGESLKKAFNALVEELEAPTAAASIGFFRTSTIQAGTVQDAIEHVQEQLAGVSQGAVADGSITEGKLAAGAVTEEKLAQDAVTNAALGAECVTGEKLAPGAVSYEKLGDSCVAGENIRDGAISPDKFSEAARGMIPGLEDFSNRVTISESPLCSGVTLQSKQFYLVRSMKMVLVDLTLKASPGARWEANLALPYRPNFASDESRQMITGGDGAGNGWCCTLQPRGSTGTVVAATIGTRGTIPESGCYVRISGWYFTEDA